MNKDIFNKFINTATFIYVKLNKFVETGSLSIINGSKVTEINAMEFIPNDNESILKIRDKNKINIIKSNWKINEKIMRLNVNDQSQFVKIDKIYNFNKFSITIEDCSLDLIVSSSKIAKLFDYMPEPKFEDLSKKLISPMPGLIKDVSVREGQKIKKGDQIVIIEAMKMENILKSEKDCSVKEILVKEGDSVSADEVLINFD